VEEGSSVTALGVCVTDTVVGISGGLPLDDDKLGFLNSYINHPALAPNRKVRRRMAEYKIQRYDDVEECRRGGTTAALGERNTSVGTRVSSGSGAAERSEPSSKQ